MKKVVLDIDYLRHIHRNVSLLPELYAQHAKFGHQGPAQGIDNTVNYIYSTWLLSSGTAHSGGVDLGVYGARYHPTSDASLMHYAIPIE